MDRRLFLQSAAAMVAGTALTTACSSGSPGGGASTAPKAKAVTGLKVRLGTAADSKGPFTVEGATKGGTVKVLQPYDFAHLDPQRVYASDGGVAATLIHRRLVAYKRVGDEQILCGDLATDTGTASDGNKTWTYTLREGVRFSDGTAVTSKHVKYGIERAYDAEITDGPTFIPAWLSGDDYRKEYTGPSGGESLPDSVIETPDDQTIVFHLKEPQADFPFACAYPITAPVLESAAKKGDFDQLPTATTGPYKVKSHDDAKMVLVRNDQWDADTDPVRAQYPESFEITFNVASLDESQQLAAADGEAVMTFSGVVDASYLSRTTGELKTRTLSEGGITSRVLGINCKRVTDVEVRRAILTAFPKTGWRRIYGGPVYGDIATDILAPVVVGFRKNDVYPVTEAGDPAAAKKILKKAGKLGTKLVYAWGQTDQGDKAGIIVAEALTRAGFEVVKKPLNSTTYFTEIGKVDKPYDIFHSGWSPDWPTGSSVIPGCFDGRTIADGATNYYNYDNDEVNAEIDRIKALTDADEANTAWAALDAKIMKDIPIVPLAYEAKTYLIGGKLGGAYVTMSPTGCQPSHVYVKA